MPHINHLYDFVVSVFIVHQEKVLLVMHKKYNEWLPIGGHIELNEDPEEALYREVKEECGLQVHILSKAPDIGHEGVKPLPTPHFMDSHWISTEHRHVAFVYFGTTSSDKVVLHEREHSSFRWVGKADLADPALKLTKSIMFYCIEALRAANAKN